MSDREKIYNKTDGHCYYCGCDLPDRWHVDHFIPIRRGQSDSDIEKWGLKRGGDFFGNKVPSCPRCNLRKDVFDIETFRKEISKQVERLLRDSSQFRLALDYGLIEITDNDVEFYFEQTQNEDE